MSRKKATKLTNLKQVDGMVRETYAAQDPVVLKTKLRSIDELWGFKGSTYPTLNENEYHISVAALNKVDLQRECVRVGLIPPEDRNVMIERLLREFRRTITSLNLSRTQPVTLKASKVAKDILSEGANRPG